MVSSGVTYVPVHPLPMSPAFTRDNAHHLFCPMVSVVDISQSKLDISNSRTAPKALGATRCTPAHPATNVTKRTKSQREITSFAVTLLVFLSTAARAWIVAADLWRFAADRHGGQYNLLLGFG